MNIHILNKLGAGLSGNAYLSVVDGKECIIKTIHAEECPPVHPVIDIINQYPEHFLTMKFQCFKLNYKCDHKIPDWISADNNRIKEWNKIHSINKGLFVCYEPVLDDSLLSYYKSMDRQLDELTNKKNKSMGRRLDEFRLETYSILAQIFYAHYILISNGWYHADAHNENIMYKSTNKKYCILTIGKNKYKCPTYGKLWYLIDYDNMYSIKLKNDIRKNFLKNLHIYIIDTLQQSTIQPWWKTAKELNIQLITREEVFMAIKKNKKYRQLLKLLPKINEPETLASCAELLLIFNYPDDFFSLIGLDNRFSNDIYKYHIQQLLKPADINFIIQHLNDCPKIIKYLINQIDHKLTIN